MRSQNDWCVVLFLKYVLSSAASHSGSDAGASKDKAVGVADTLS